MSIAKEIAPNIPYLRRFARSLSGTQQGGDAYVVSTLEALIADPSSFSHDMNPKVALYRAFIQLWASIAVNNTRPETLSAEPAHRNLSLLTPRSRQAFLLRTVEGFSADETSAILGITKAEMQDLITEAGREIARQVATDVLIIEDEPLIALDIEQIVLDLGHAVTGIARTHTAALKLAQEKRPGIVLADIQLADGSSGLDAVHDILGMIDVPVIFITAYPERLLTGERREPAFLITKPFLAETVKAAVSQALFFKTAAAIVDPAA